MVSRLGILGLVRLASRIGSAALLLVAVPAEAACTDVAAPKVDWRRCTLDGGDYAGRKLNGAELRDASFSLANLAGADLSDGDAYHAKFLSTNLKGARLDRANLSEADFTRADLTGASLADADLRRAHFFRANLRDANLTGAQMTGADLLNADLSGALWIDGKRRCGAGSIGQCF
jgi:uncharacterized protein YjbI with pentapeptide repeats